ncbi:MAG TPA: DegT/DnrJ/EryC1/StrS family aminotransferase [Planctomycetota bacterium]|nr:DegT/DnrJ/EryC1/StrS family aminotransferase [Planctomycetota bacterium]
MNVPLLDLKAQYAPLREEIRAAIDRVCDSQHFILGPEVQGLEKEVARFCGATFAIGMSSGTDALLAALMAANVGPGDEVITTAYSFFATAGAVARLGAMPVFVDIERETFNIDARQVEARITPKTKVILPVHLYGRCADLEALLASASKRKIALIEDAAQAIGSTDARGRQAGTVGAMGCFSFFPTKNLGGFGDGGLVTTNDAALAESLRVLRVHGSKLKYYHKVVGGNFRLDAIQAAVLRVKLKHLPAWTVGRRSNAERYRKLFAEAGLRSKVGLPSDVPGHIYNQFVIRVERRDALQAFLTGRKIGSEVYYPVPLHLQECFAGLGLRKGSLPVSEEMAATSLALPIYPELTAVQQETVVDAVAEFCRA